MNYNWKIKGKYEEGLWKFIKDEHCFSTDRLLERFLDFKQISKFDEHTLPNIDSAVERVKKAIDNDEHIMIAGDYDCDGVTATATMVVGLRTVARNVSWIVPLRKDGYGLSKKMIQKAIDKKVDLIITVDNGINANEAIDYARENNIDVVVTDHHISNGKLPNAIVVDPFIDSSIAFKEICGCMVAFKFLQVLIPDLKNKIGIDFFGELTTFATIATVADSMPLLEENRRFVHFGLNIMNNPKYFIGYGVEHLLKKGKIQRGAITSSSIGFTIAPMINAIGRMDDASKAVELLLTDDEVVAERLAEQAFKWNDERKDLENKKVAEAEVDENDGVLVVVFDDVPKGVVGVLAGKIGGKYQRPCFVMRNDNGILAGSGRGISDFKLRDCITSCADIGVGGGGHSGACGIHSLREEYLPEFKKRCKKLYFDWLAQNDGKPKDPTMVFLFELGFDKINDNFVDDIEKLAPFGLGNREPMFCTMNVNVADYKVIGAKNNAVRFDFEKNGTILKGICFNDVKDKYIDELGAPDKVDIGFIVQYNVWNGNKTIQLQLKDIKACG